MPRKLSLPIRLLAVTVLTAGSLLYADDNTTDSDGYKHVSIKTADGKTAYIRVQKDADPFHNLPAPAPSDKYDPERIFSHTSTLADKSFSMSDSASARNASTEKDLAERTFTTKSYTDNASSSEDRSTPNINTKFPTESSNAYGHNAADSEKRFDASDSDRAQNKMALFASATSPDQGRTANLGNGDTSTYASSLSNKTYLGPEADAVHRSLDRINQGLMQMKDLPNRPLTIDEVRALINHGVKPDTDAPPEPQSKPLNDPDYKPEPLRDTPPVDTEDDKDDAVPPPGTMASPPPENSEPLPSR